MRIGIDGRSLTVPPNGIGRYVGEICSVIDYELPSAQFVIYANNPIKWPAPSPRWSVRVEPIQALRAIPYSLWLSVFAGRLCQSDCIDVYWAPASRFPRGLPSSCGIVSTVNDLNVRLVPETMPWLTRVFHRLEFARAIRHADAIVTISQGTRRRLNQLFLRDADAVALPATGPNFRKLSSLEISRARAELGLNHPYLLTVGSLEPRKNHIALIEAFVRLKKDGHLPPDTELVLAGSPGWRNRRVWNALKKAARHGVRHIGYVNERLLPGLYAACSAFVFPSIYEGFGIPVAEASACGATVVIADISELREAASADAICVNATVDGIAAGILAAMAAPAPMTTHAGAQTWADAGHTYARIFERIFREKADRHSAGIA